MTGARSAGDRRGRTAADARRPDERGQTLIDYAIGVGLFLLAVAFVFSYVPGMLDPFTAEQENVQLADRAATQLSEHHLARPGEPFVLDAECTDKFFTGDPDVGGCPFDDYGSDLSNAFGADDATHFEVSIVQADGTVVDRTVPLTAGETPPSGSQAVTTARRAVHYRDRTYQLVVRVW